MSVPEAPSRGRLATAWLLLLTLTAGSVDANSFYELQVFTANMTGNAVLLGIAIGSGAGASAVRSAFALAGFSFGACAGAAALRRRSPAEAWSIRAATATAIEAAILLAGFIVLRLENFEPSTGNALAVVVLVSVAMGLQSGVVWRLRIPGVSTTFVTGTIIGLMSGLTDGPAAHPPRGESGQRLAVRTSWQRMAALQAATFVVYGAGAALTGLVHSSSALWAQLVPLAGIAAAILVSVEAHREKSHR
ncbi:DUF1275 family protein [Vulgatibacter incomptus]|uniref:DUF1275 domain-containing protein n=1 Tax=Vulgatibacter incomptus TaxID=1391653 RepID=A0A0K1PG95_9BACT|nr:YoaK family protein [Vulgatibacter incomptus]AKU92441.1 hypothetical protein AKJ08_2828 [Vulgatibacter incomptus]